MVCKKPEALIVDDDVTVCNMLTDELTDHGYLCSKAFDGNDAVDKLAIRRFDLVLLDIRLPGRSGMEVLRRMRADHHNAIVIMLTAVNNVDTAVHAMKLGASDYIVKPFGLDELNTSIHTLMETKKHSVERDSGQTLSCLDGDGEDRPSIGESSRAMNAIATGVEARLDFLTDHSEILTQETIEVARQLGIPEGEIRRWAAARARLDSERNRAIESSLIKLQRSPLVQQIMGLLDMCTPESKQSQN